MYHVSRVTYNTAGYVVLMYDVALYRIPIGKVHVTHNLLCVNTVAHVMVYM